jgi:hypothetical protein
MDIEHEIPEEQDSGHNDIKKSLFCRTTGVHMSATVLPCHELALME